MLAAGVFGLVAMLICFLSAVFMKRTVIDAIDQGRFHDAKNDSVIWVVFGLIGFVLPALLLMLTYVKVSDSLTASNLRDIRRTLREQSRCSNQHRTLRPSTGPAGACRARGAARTGSPRSSDSDGEVQELQRPVPVFMHSCPNCGAPKE